MRMMRAHERTRIIVNSHTERHATAPPDSAEPAGPTTRAETAAPARAAPEAASPSTGPASFLAAHPLAYGLSLAGSGAAAIYGITVARQHPRHRVLWLALGAHCTAQFAGIVIATEIARRRASGRRRTSGRNRIPLPQLAPPWRTLTKDTTSGPA